MEVAEGKVNKFKGRSIEIIQSKKKWGKKVEK